MGWQFWGELRSREDFTIIYISTCMLIGIIWGENEKHGTEEAGEDK